MPVLLLLLLLLFSAALAAAESAATQAAVLRDPFAAATASEPEGDGEPLRALALARRQGVAVVLLALGGERALAAPGDSVTLGRQRFTLRTLQGEEAVVSDAGGAERRLRVFSSTRSTP